MGSGRGPGRNGGPMMHGPGGFRPSGTGRQRRRQALGTCGLSRRKFGAQKDPAMLMMPAAYPIRTL